MEWALARVAGAQHAATQLIIVRLRDIDWEYSSDPSIPCDFDPVAYLLHNVDILMSGVKPYKHYIVSGHLESGRRWRWEQCKTEAQEKFGNDLQNDQQN
jgi:hypothetical protein